MSIGTDDSDTALRAALLATLAVAADSVPAAAPPWPQTRERLVRIGRRRRRRTATAVLGCAALVAAAGAVGVALLPGSPDRAARVGTEQPEDLHAQVGFPLVGQDDWMAELRRRIVADPPWWTTNDIPGDTVTYLPVRPDQVELGAAEELGGLRVVQVTVSVDYREAGAAQTKVTGDQTRYIGPAGDGPGPVVELRGNPDAAAWPEPGAPGWVDVLSTRMVDDVALQVRDSTGRVQTVPLGGSQLARVYAPGAQFVSLLNARGDGEQLLTVPVRPLDLAGMRATPPPVTG